MRSLSQAEVDGFRDFVLGHGDLGSKNAGRISGAAEIDKVKCFIHEALCERTEEGHKQEDLAMFLFNLGEEKDVSFGVVPVNTFADRLGPLVLPGTMTDACEIIVDLMREEAAAGRKPILYIGVGAMAILPLPKIWIPFAATKEWRYHGQIPCRDNSTAAILRSLMPEILFQVDVVEERGFHPAEMAALVIANDDGQPSAVCVASAVEIGTKLESLGFTDAKKHLISHISIGRLVTVVLVKSGLSLESVPLEMPDSVIGVS